MTKKDVIYTGRKQNMPQSTANIVQAWPSKTKLDAIIETAAGAAKVALSPSEGIDVFTKLVKGTVRQGLLGGFSQMLEHMRRKGEISEDALNHENFIQATNLLTQILDDNDVIKEKFEIAQEIFLGACIVGEDQLESPVLLELMRTAGSLSRAGILTLRAATVIQKEALTKTAVYPSLEGFVAHVDWRHKALILSGLGFEKFIIDSISELTNAGLVESSTASYGNNYFEGYRLTEMGKEIANLIETYESTK